jgi:hypothetical protein
MNSRPTFVVIRVAQVAIGMPFVSPSSSVKPETSHVSPVSSHSAQFAPAKHVSAWESISFRAMCPGSVIPLGVVVVFVREICRVPSLVRLPEVTGAKVRSMHVVTLAMGQRRWYCPEPNRLPFCEPRGSIVGFTGGWIPVRGGGKEIAVGVPLVIDPGAECCPMELMSSPGWVPTAAILRGSCWERRWSKM